LVLDSLNDVTWKNVASLNAFLNSLDLSDEPKKIVERLTNEKIEIRTLLNPDLEIEDIREVLNGLKIKGGDLLKIYAGLRRVRNAISSRAAADLPKILLKSEEFRNSQSDHIVNLAEFKKNENKKQVFVSYSWSNKTKVRKLKDILESAGVNCWMDENMMMGGEHLFEEIDKGISSCDIFLACSSDQYAASENCRKEVLLAHDRKKIIVPIWIANCEVWPPRGDTAVVLAGKLYVDLASEEKFQDSVKALIMAVKKGLNLI